MIERSIIIDAICGAGFKTMQNAIDAEKMGMAKFVGNQWNPDWAWNRDWLKAKSDIELENIYNVYCDKGDE